MLNNSEIAVLKVSEIVKISGVTNFVWLLPNYSALFRANFV